MSLLTYGNRFLIIKSQNSKCLPLLNVSTANYSRRGNAHENGPFKVVTKSEEIDDLTPTNLKQINNTNWELLASRDYPFYLPGSCGPAWQNAQTSLVPKTHLTAAAFNAEFDLRNLTVAKVKRLSRQNTSFKCAVQKCPTLLRKDVSELFPGRDSSTSVMTVVTLSRHSGMRTATLDAEIEMERLAKSFVVTAQDICLTLNRLGYWADFVNPFSGRPYLSNHNSSRLYRNDERFRCLGFLIINQSDCKIISNESNLLSLRNFRGNLFTNAPHSLDYFKHLTGSEAKND